MREGAFVRDTDVLDWNWTDCGDGCKTCYPIPELTKDCWELSTNVARKLFELAGLKEEPEHDT